MLKIEIITPERLVHTTEGEEVIVPTVNGMIGIRTGHVALIAPLKPGEIIVKNGSLEQDFLAVAGGFVEVNNNVVRILADSAEHAHEIDELAITEAIERAKQAKADTADRVEHAEATALIELNLARLKVAGRKKSHGSHPKTPESI